MTQDQIAVYLAQYPDADPANNLRMRECINSPDYEDHGMWGPLGGKGGTVSQPWCEEYERINSGRASELGLAVVIEPQIRPEILSVPLQHPDDFYPTSCRTPEERRVWEEEFVASGLLLPPLSCLPAGSLLREEWLCQAAAARSQHKPDTAL